LNADEGDVEMVTRIEVEQSTAERLAKKAKSTGLSVDSLLKHMLDTTDLAPQGAVTIEEFDRIFDELAAGSENLPPLPTDFSRTDIYTDHD
jgi:hypothetical protein